MLKRFCKRMSAFIIALTLTLMSVPLATHAASDDVITIIHTNDMHGRLAEKVNTEDDGSFAYTKLAGLRKYAEDNKADLILDAGDAIQGLPISNISKSKYMIQAMIEVGYYAMTVGNHEFDFGQDQILSLRNDYQEDDKFYILSNNTKKDSDFLFDRSMIAEVKDKNVAING